MSADGKPAASPLTSPHRPCCGAPVPRRSGARRGLPTTTQHLALYGIGNDGDHVRLALLEEIERLPDRLARRQKTPCRIASVETGSAASCGVACRSLTSTHPQ